MSELEFKYNQLLEWNVIAIEKTEQLERENEMLKASLDRLRSHALKRGSPSDDVQKLAQVKQWIKDLVAIANETPEQSLAKIEAAAIEKLKLPYPKNTPVQHAEFLTNIGVCMFDGVFLACGIESDYEPVGDDQVEWFVDLSKILKQAGE